MDTPPSYNSKNTNGFVLITSLVLVVIISVVYLSVINSGLIKKNSLPENTPLPSDSPMISDTETALPSPKLSTPTPTPKITPTAKPVSTMANVPVAGGVSTINVVTAKGNFTATVLSLDLGSTRVITDTANDSDCGTGCPVSSLQTFVNKNGGFAGVNGTYFCPITYPDCSGKTNSFDFPVYNTRLGKWINGGSLFWNGRSIIYFDGSGAHFLQNANSFSGGLTAGIVNYPGLVNGGEVQIDDNQSGLSDKQKAVGTKVGIGIKGSTGVMVVVANNVNMQQFAYVFKSLGATGALNLDTGGSTALYYAGKYVYGPGRDIPNAIIFATK